MRGRKTSGQETDTQETSQEITRVILKRKKTETL
jgi:hypothetical protein